MKQLIISSSAQNEYLIAGDTNALLQNNMARLALKKLKYDISPDGLLISSDETIDYIAKTVKIAAKYIKAEIVYDEQANEDIKDFQAREEAFAEFSQQACLTLCLCL